MESSNIQSLSFLLMFLYMIHTHAQTRFYPVVTHALTYTVIILFPLISSSFSPLPLKSSKTILSVWEEHKQQIRHAAILDTRTSHIHTCIFIFTVCACYVLFSLSDHPNRLIIELCQQYKKGSYVETHTQDCCGKRFCLIKYHYQHLLSASLFETD